MDPTRTNESTASGAGEESQVREQGKEVARQSKEQASWYASEVRERAKDQIASRQQWASDELSGVSKALQQSAGQLQEQNQDSAGRYADQAAGQVDRLAGHIRDSDAEQLIRQVEDFARSRPSVFLGGAFAVGALAARFAKSSSREGGSGHSEADAIGGHPSSSGAHNSSASAGGSGSYVDSSDEKAAPRRAGDGRVR